MFLNQNTNYSDRNKDLKNLVLLCICLSQFLDEYLQRSRFSSATLQLSVCPLFFLKQLCDKCFCLVEP